MRYTACGCAFAGDCLMSHAHKVAGVRLVHTVNLSSTLAHPGFEGAVIGI